MLDDLRIIACLIIVAIMAANALQLRSMLVLWCLIWYGTSTALNVFNKLTFTVMCGGLVYPNTIAACHILLKGFLAYLYLRRIGHPLVWSRFRLASVVGLAAGGDICLTNWAVSCCAEVSLTNLLKASSLPFTFLLSIYTGVGVVNTLTALAVVTVTGGIALCFYHKLSGGFPSLVGVGMVLTASFFAAVRWVLAEILLKSKEERLSPVEILLYSSPSAFLMSLVLLVMSDELPAAAADPRLHTTDSAACIVPTVLAGALCAFLLFLSEAQVVNIGSALSLSIAGQLKEALVVFTAVAVFSEAFYTSEALGMLAITIGAVLYSWGKQKGAVPPG